MSEDAPESMRMKVKGALPQALARLKSGHGVFWK